MAIKIFNFMSQAPIEKQVSIACRKVRPLAIYEYRQFAPRERTQRNCNTMTPVVRVLVGVRLGVIIDLHRRVEELRRKSRVLLDCAIQPLQPSSVILREPVHHGHRCQGACPSEC